MRKTAVLVSVILGLAALSCDGDDPTGSADTSAADSGVQDSATGDAVQDSAAGDAALDAVDATIDAATTAGACGPTLTCEADKACEAVGQGACGGPAPDENGDCAPGCSPTECGGGTHCLCTSYSCIDLPPGWTGCDYTWTDWHSSCICDDSKDPVMLDCPGA